MSQPPTDPDESTAGSASSQPPTSEPGYPAPFTGPGRPAPHQPSGAHDGGPGYPPGSAAVPGYGPGAGYPAQDDPTLAMPAAPGPAGQPVPVGPERRAYPPAEGYAPPQSGYPAAPASVPPSGPTPGPVGQPAYPSVSAAAPASAPPSGPMTQPAYPGMPGTGQPAYPGAPMSGRPYGQPASGPPYGQPASGPPYGQPASGPSVSGAPSAVGGPPGGKGRTVLVLALVAALLFVVAGLMSGLFIAKSGELDRTGRTLRAQVAERDAKLDANAKEIEGLKRDLEAANDKLGAVEQDLTGTKNARDELERQKRVISRCLDLLGDAATATSKSAYDKAMKEADKVCAEADDYL